MNIQHPYQFLFSKDHPFTSEFEVEFIGCEDHVLSLSIVTSQKYAKVPGGEIAHTSFSSIFLDTAMGCAVLGELKVMQPIATLNLMVNHHREPIVGEILVCHSKYHGEQKDVANVTAELISAKSNDMVATGIGTFMIGTRSKPVDQGSDQAK